MSVEFSNTYQEILLENLVAIIKQNFMFQTQLKLAENIGKNNLELQAKYDDLLTQFEGAKNHMNELETYKSKVLVSDSEHEEKNRIQIALNDMMKKQAGLEKELLDKEMELNKLKNYIKKLEDIAPLSKLKKINPNKLVEHISVEQPAQDLFAIKVNDGSSF